MTKNYLFIQDIQDNYNLSHFNFTDIHIWNVAPISEQQNNQQVYFYTKNLEEFNTILKTQHIAHLTFLGDNLFSDFYTTTLKPEFNSLERFWFPEKKHLNQEYINKFLDLPEINTTSVAIVFNPHIQKDITYFEFYSFLNLLYSQYNSPLFDKDLSMYEQEFFSQHNAAIINGKKHCVVLGLFGDCYLPDFPDSHVINLGILKDSKCVMCDFANACIQRGLGIIKHTEKIKSCIGIKLYNQN